MWKKTFEAIYKNYTEAKKVFKNFFIWLSWSKENKVNFTKRKLVKFDKVKFMSYTLYKVKDSIHSLEGRRTKYAWVAAIVFNLYYRRW